jgi:DNA-binding HxlR family transcriptional regulator
MSEEVTKRTQDPLSEKVRQLEEAKRILEDVEATTLSDVALALTEAAESLSHTAKELADMRTTEWMTAEQAAKHLGCESLKAFEKIAAREGLPKHYLSARAPRYNRAELDAWLKGRRAH